MDLMAEIQGLMQWSSLVIIFTLIILESLLSIDNAAVLATMVMVLPENQRDKALKYGIIGAFVFRGICLALVSVLVQFIWLKIAGGLYLCYLAYGHFFKEEAEAKAPKPTKILWFNYFWSTVIMVEIMDLAFSIDNVFAAAAMTKSILLICIGVFIGILAMRFVAQRFVHLMEKYPSLAHSAYWVILLLGLKLIVAGIADYVPAMAGLKHLMENHVFDLAFSGLMVFIFIIPLLFSKKDKGGDGKDDYWKDYPAEDVPPPSREDIQQMYTDPYKLI
jgi:YkoY family integral membrane protein